ncbi:MAG: ABC transporter substrate-binding protein [Pseudomonadota bacterium]
MSFKSILPVALLALPAQTALAGGHLTPFSFGTNWVAQAEHGGFYQAVADGTYAECGLDVTILPGGPQVNGRALMMAGKMDAYMGGNMLLPWNARLEGIPITVVAASFQKEPQVLMTHPGAVEKFEDIADLETLIIGDGGYQSYFQLLINEYGFSAEKRVPYTYNPAPFIADETAAQQGYVTSEPFAIQREGGFAPDVWLLADYGFSTYSTTVEMMQPSIDANPDAVKCFVEGSAIGWTNFLYGDNSAALEMIQMDNPDMSDEQIAFSLESLKKYGIVDSGDSVEMGIGAMTDARMEDFYKRMVAAGVIADGLDISETYTTEYSNSGASLEVKKSLLSN